MTPQPRLTPLQQIQKWIEQSPEGRLFTAAELLPLFKAAVRDDFKLKEEAFDRGWYDRGYDRQIRNDYKNDFFSQFKSE